MAPQRAEAPGEALLRNGTQYYERQWVEEAASDETKINELTLKKGYTTVEIHTLNTKQTRKK